MNSFPLDNRPKPSEPAREERPAVAVWIFAILLVATVLFMLLPAIFP